MNAQQPDEQHPDLHVLVTPAYLAGRGNPADLSNSLYAHRDWGWTSTDTGQIFVSPRHDTHIAYLPQGRYGGWKVTQYREPLGMPIWSATFSPNTPTEIISAFTDALIDRLASDHPHSWNSGPAGQVTRPADTLAERGWRNTDTNLDFCHRSPDGHAYLSESRHGVNDYAELEGGYRARWTMYACVDVVNGERWHADFTNRTPLHLITEVTRAFSSTEPVERPRSGIPERNLPYVTITPIADDVSDHRQSAALTRTGRGLPIGPSLETGTAAPNPSSPLRSRRR
ncbi:DUF317 domain-containing protein [Actinacidiphila acididurans]|uniref:DUF317 domain-containing protein n=1 Tax=Actinacidiphila acididurans TaxID=2784346 RepID=A0ABS2TXE8_9ACTN|nr:DUF317 domain-containing protein [Actinacidiphila acididurans]MBM9508022.1 DUF317 domain-containing protein [Actinacidiphila acididurans]